MLRVDRDDSGKLKKLHGRKSKASKSKAQDEAMIVLEIDRHSDVEDLRDLEAMLQQVLHEVRIAVTDFPVMRDKAKQIMDELESIPAQIDKDELHEAREFVQWLTQDHFTFLGYDEYLSLIHI